MFDRVYGEVRNVGGLSPFLGGGFLLKPVLENLKQVLFLTTVCIVIEFFQFAFLGLVYPYPNNIGLWFSRNFFYGAVLFRFWFRSSKPGKPIFVGILLTLAIQLAYPGTMFCGLDCSGFIYFALPGIAGACIAITVVSLFFCTKLKKEEINRWFLGGATIVAYLVLKPLHVAHLETKHQLRWWTSFSASFEELQAVSSNMTETQWISLCKQFGFLSFGNHLFGGLHKAYCYQYGACIYDDKSLCEKLPESYPQGSYVSKPPDLPLRIQCLNSVDEFRWARWKTKH